MKSLVSSSFHKKTSPENAAFLRATIAIFLIFPAFKNTFTSNPLSLCSSQKEIKKNEKGIPPAAFSKR
ncbi:hypothetical protein DMA11_22535 [Marinilabiliaceae bacterium JC017]|nr:hypothetical protein DMA11_22535 [Marinilabiliaceae bacterium JC017]